MQSVGGASKQGVRTRVRLRRFFEDGASKLDIFASGVVVHTESPTGASPSAHDGSPSFVAARGGTLKRGRVSKQVRGVTNWCKSDKVASGATEGKRT